MKAMLNELRLTNFGPFQGEKIIKFSGPGTYAVCASNGKGKSHVVTAAKIAAAPTSTLDKPMGAYVYGNGLAGVTSAKIHAEFDFGGEPLSVTKSFSLSAMPEEELRALLDHGDMPKCGSKVQVTFRGETIKSASDASELLTSLFGIENKVQEDAVFILQNKAGEIIQVPPSVRSKAMQFLCGAEICQKAADSAQRRLGTIKVIDRRAEITAKEGSISTLQTRINTDTASMTALKAAKVSAADVTGIRSELTASFIGHRAATMVQTLTAELAKLTKDLQLITHLHMTTGMTAITVRDDLAAKAAEVVEARKALASAEANVSLVKQKKALLSLVDELEKEPESHAAPKKPAESKEKMKELAAFVTLLSDEAAVHARAVTTFSKSERCPTCGMKPENRQQLLDEHTKKYNEFNAELTKTKAEFDALSAAWSKYDVESSRYASWMEGWQKRITNVTEQLSGLGNVEEVQPHGDAVVIVKAYEAAERELRKLEAEIASAEQSMVHLQKSIDDKKQRMADEAELAKDALDDEQEQKLKVQLQEIEGQAETVARLEGALNANRSALETANDELARLQADQAAGEVKLKQIEFLEGIKSVMHHSAVPHDRAIAYLNHMNKLMANYCEILHAPFTLFVDQESHTFMQQMNGAVRPAYQLSGGQFTIASWAWHLALYEKHGSSVGFIFMDEPTVGLDDANLSNIGEAVSHLAKYCRGSGLQFIMVTHERDLASVFDEVIAL